MRQKDRQERVAEAILEVRTDVLPGKVRGNVLRALHRLMNDIGTISHEDFVSQYEEIRSRIADVIPELDLVSMYVPQMNGELVQMREEFINRSVVYKGELRKQLGEDPAVVTDVNEKLFILEGKEMPYGSTHNFSHAAFFRGMKNGMINMVEI